MPFFNFQKMFSSLVSFHSIGLMLTVLTMSSCSLFGGDERPVYQGAEYYKNLEVPPNLTPPDTTDELKVPKPTDEALKSFREKNELEMVITPEFDGVRTVNFAGSSWLEIDNSVEQVWPKLISFWQHEGIKLVQVRPQLGFMETAWIERKDRDAGFVRSLFQRFEPDQKDKFRLRVERFDNDSKTRLFVSNSKIERVVYSGEDEQGMFIWESKPSDLEAENEIISRLAIYSGLTDDQATALLEDYHPYVSLVKTESTNSTTLTMTGDMDFVWRRAVRALDRMNMDDVQQHLDDHTITFVAGTRSDEILDTKEEDELSKTSWLMQLFSDKSGKDAATDINRQFRLEFTDLNGSVQIVVKDAKDSQSTDEQGNVGSTVRVEQIRNALVENLE
jgi:outer membrane protein assembly factor BamC